MDIFKKSHHLTIDELSNYALGKDDRSKRHCVEHHLNDCPLCADAIDGYRLRNMQQKPSPKSVSFLAGMSRFTAAASILVLLGTAFYFYAGAAKGISCDKLFEAHFEMPTDYSTLRATKNTATNLPERLNRAMDFFKDKELAESAKLFHQQLQEDPSNTFSLYHLGTIYLYQGKTSDAASFFENVREDNSCKEYKNAAWYLALCALKNGDKETSVLWLKTTTEEGGLYYDEADKLLKKLKPNG